MALRPWQGHLTPATTDGAVTNIWWDGAGAWDVLLEHLSCLGAHWERGEVVAVGKGVWLFLGLPYWGMQGPFGAWGRRNHCSIQYFLSQIR